VFTSSLGTHTFFMTGLPACFFFGYDQFGHGCVYLIVLSMRELIWAGCYSSWHWECTPRRLSRTLHAFLGRMLLLSRLSTYRIFLQREQDI
jgi:hypothetical protein